MMALVKFALIISIQLRVNLSVPLVTRTLLTLWTTLHVPAMLAILATVSAVRIVGSIELLLRLVQLTSSLVFA